MKVYTDAIEKAIEAYSKALEKLVIETVKSLARKDPHAEFSFISGMGTWAFERTGVTDFGTDDFDIATREIEPEPAFSILQDADSEYPTAMPTIWVKANGNQVEIKHEW
jgi:hypothetical protein